MAIQREAGRITFSGPQVEYPLLPGAQDRISWLLQLAAVLLLVAIIAAIALTLRRRKDVKGQDPAQQVRARKADRLRIVKMDAVREAPAAPAADAAPAAAPKGQA